VKAGDFPLTANSLSLIEELLLKPSSIGGRRKVKAHVSKTAYTAADISPRIRSCLDDGGTFVTLLFGNDGIDIEEDATQKAIQAFLARIDHKYAGAKVKVWRQSRICAMLRHFLGVSLQIKGVLGLPVLSHAQWSQRPDMQFDFIAAQDQKKAIDGLRAVLRDDNRGSLHVRMLGEPGIGKTRADDLRPLTL
jgi:hypothetical protein